MKSNHVACGGTFDHFHNGHKKFLEECLHHGRKVTVGITDKALLRHKAYNFSLQSYAVRVKKVTQFNSVLHIYRLRAIYGPTITDTTIDVICVTKDTLHGAEMINIKRKEIGMKALPIIIAPFVYDQNNEKISSENIRQGIVDREGNRYDSYLIGTEKRILPEFLKGGLRKPLGRIIPTFSLLSRNEIDKVKGRIEKQGYCYECAVGDIMTYEMKKQGITPSFSIIDGLTKRKALNSEILRLILDKDRCEAINERGTIGKDACTKIKYLFDSGHKRATKQLYIHGEEDLLTLAAVLLAPLNSHIWYGQWDVGAIDVCVTEKKKQTVYNLLKQFK